MDVLHALKDIKVMNRSRNCRKQMIINTSNYLWTCLCDQRVMETIEFMTYPNNRVASLLSR